MQPPVGAEPPQNPPGTSTVDNLSEERVFRSRLEPQQLLLVRQMSKGAWQFDPTRAPGAWTSWKHLSRDLDVRDLLQTHNVVGNCFPHGEYRGSCVDDLVRLLVETEGAAARQLPPLVVVRFQRQNWVVCGNRRLKALKACADRLRKAVYMRCILHDTDASVEVPLPLIGKFIDASTTLNGGMFAEFRK